MKRLICFILTIALCLSLCACGSNKTEAPKQTAKPAPTATVTPEPAPEPKDEPKTKEYYLGTWSMSGIVSGENFMSVDDMIKNGASEEVRDFKFIFNDNNQFCFEGTIGAWSVTEYGALCGSVQVKLDNDRLIIPMDGENYDLAFVKTSDSQEFPEEKPEEPTDELSGIRPEFKAAMDSFEAFYDEYCDFMKKYAENPADLNMLLKYADMLTKLDDMQKKLDAWESEDMSNEELQYYIEVTARIEKKLIGVLG